MSARKVYPDRNRELKERSVSYIELHFRAKQIPVRLRLAHDQHQSRVPFITQLAEEHRTFMDRGRGRRRGAYGVKESSYLVNKVLAVIITELLCSDYPMHIGLHQFLQKRIGRVSFILTRTITRIDVRS